MIKKNILVIDDEFLFVEHIIVKHKSANIIWFPSLFRAKQWLSAAVHMKIELVLCDFMGVNSVNLWQVEMNGLEEFVSHEKIIVCSSVALLRDTKYVFCNKDDVDDLIEGVLNPPI